MADDTATTETIPPMRTARGRYVANVRHHGTDHPATQAARRDLTAAVAEQLIRELADSAPPLTDEQRTYLASILQPPTAPDPAGAHRPGQ